MCCLSQLALRLDRAAHQPRELKRDREPETGPAELARGARLRLYERPEQLVDVPGRDSDAGIPDLERHLQAMGLPDNADLEHHLALGGELDGVGEKVCTDLAHSHAIAAYSP